MKNVARLTIIYYTREKPGQCPGLDILRDLSGLEGLFVQTGAAVNSKTDSHLTEFVTLGKNRCKGKHPNRQNTTCLHASVLSAIMT